VARKKDTDHPKEDADLLASPGMEALSSLTERLLHVPKAELQNGTGSEKRTTKPLEAN
jgi:hypothetical protein